MLQEMSTVAWHLEPQPLALCWVLASVLAVALRLSEAQKSFELPGSLVQMVSCHTNAL